MLTLGAALAVGTESSTAESVAVAAPALLCLLLLTTRLDPELLGFLPYLGYRPAFTAAAVAALPTACFAAAAAAIAIAAPPRARVLLLLFVAHLAVAIVSIFRAWLYPGRGARSVELQVQVELAGLLLIGSLLPPLAVAALAWRAATLWRHYRSRRWIHS